MPATPPETSDWVKAAASLFLPGAFGFLVGLWLGAYRKRWLNSIRLTGPVPVLISVIVLLVGLIITYQSNQNAVGFSIGTSVAATGVAGLFMYFYAANQQGQISRLEAYSRFGLEAIFDGRGPAIRAEYEERLRSARRHIDLIGFGQQQFLEDHYNDFAAWKECAHVRILLIDPDYPTAGASFADVRDAEENARRGKIRDDVIAFVSRTRHLIGTSNNGSFQVKRYRALPTVNIFRIDESLYWGPYLMRLASRNSPTLRVGEGGLLYKRLAAHFDEIWNDPILSLDVPSIEI